MGVSRSGRRVDDAYDAMYTTAQLDQVLPETEILPWPCPARRRRRASSPAAALPCCPRTAVVVNVGRGTAIDQTPDGGLNAGRLAGAALDVVRRSLCPRSIPCGTPKTSC